MFHDHARISVEAGRGGSGAISFRREKYVPRGGPSGGDGGHGGDVILRADPDRRDLSAIHHNPHIRAERGQHGEGQGRKGRDGASRELLVPVGTQVYDEAGTLIADLAHPGATVVLAHGGRGGQGNRRFKTATRQAPRVAEAGQPGEALIAELRLKLLCDAALLGFPNAGKSSLLRQLSNATPKVGDYPFTTLAPVLGTVDGPEARQLILADVPGLIEGASEGLGLGHEFLAHLERAALFVHVIDGAESDPAARFDAIDSELRSYGNDLVGRPQIVFLNKSDLGRAGELAVDDSRVCAVIRGSAVTGEGVDELRSALFRHVDRAPTPRGELADYLVYRPRAPGRRGFRILRTQDGWSIAATRPEQLDRAVLEAALRDAGARSGQRVEVGDEEFELT